MHIIFFIFDRITALDAVGPYEVLSRLPGARVQFAAAEPGVVKTDNGFLGLAAEVALAEVPSCDILVVPGGWGTRELESNEAVLAEIRRLHETTRYTTSVCTGSHVLAAAGLLEGLEATSHWALLDHLATYGARPVSRRVVEAGKIVTAAGVSAGIDMALTLVARIAGDGLAQAIQLGIEYDPAPPFDSGSVAKAPPPVVEMVRAALAAT